VKFGNGEGRMVDGPKGISGHQEDWKAERGGKIR
jgi:hypothetical protein